LGVDGHAPQVCLGFFEYVIVEFVPDGLYVAFVRLLLERIAGRSTRPPRRVGGAKQSGGA
jgi:hypothetical protein